MRSFRKSIKRNSNIHIKTLKISQIHRFTSKTAREIRKMNERKCRVRFNDSWFVFHDSSWSFHEPYFRRKEIFTSLKTGKQVTNYLKNILINDIHHHSFFIKQMLCKHHFSRSPNSKLKTRDNEPLKHLKHYLIYCGA